MKKLSKVLLALMAFAAAVFVATSFVSCSDDSDDDGASTGASTVAVYKDTESGVKTVTFYPDKTFKVHVNGEQSESGVKLVFDFDFMTGTYTGAPDADGEIVLTVVKSVIYEANLARKVADAVAAGKTSVTFTNADYPLENVENAEPVTLTVANGLVTFDGTEYKRQ